jgi:hypothetical protein
MSKQAPFTIKIFVADGDPDGLRVVERSNWTGKALMFPRALYPDVRSRSEFQQTGVYLLLGPSSDGTGETLYVGEGDPVKPRFEDHYVKKDFWTRAVFFVAPGQLNKAHVQFLEAQLVSLAGAAKRMTLENGNRPTEPTLSEADRADMEVFLHNMLGVLPVLGIQAFDQTIAGPGTLNPVFFCKGRGASATGQDTPQGFVVKSGSQAADCETPSLKGFPIVIRTRDELKKRGVLVPDGGKLRFTQSYAFNSPSLAAAVVLGRSANGRVDWKDAAGRTLKEYQQSQAEG